MEKLFKDLAWYCVENDLNFDYSARAGSLHIYEKKSFEIVAYGYIKNWKHESPEKVLSRMQKEAVDYLQGADENAR